MQMNSMGKGGKQRCLRGSNIRQEILQVCPRFDHQRSAKFAIDRMLDENIKNLDAVIDQDLEFLFGPLRLVTASENRPKGPGSLFREAISLGGGKYLVPAGAQDRDILHDALSAHPEAPRQLAALCRRMLSLHPRKHPSAARIT
jgi:hypothetical protein